MSSYKEIWDLRITCTDENLIPPLEHNYSCVMECDPLYGMPMRRFYKERERYEGDDEPYVIWKWALDRESCEDNVDEDEVWLWRVLLVSGTHIAEMPPEIFEQQNMLLIYRTASEGEFIESVQPLLARQTDEFYRHLNNLDIFASQMRIVQRPLCTGLDCGGAKAVMRIWGTWTIRMSVKRWHRVMGKSNVSLRQENCLSGMRQ